MATPNPSSVGAFFEVLSDFNQRQYNPPADDSTQTLQTAIELGVVQATGTLIEQRVQQKPARWGTLKWGRFTWS